MSLRDEWIIYLGGFTTNLPFLLSKWNHKGIHIGLMCWNYDFKGWAEWPGEYLQGFARDMIQHDDFIYFFIFLIYLLGGGRQPK